MGLDARKRVSVKMMLPVTELPASVIVFLVTTVISVNTVRNRCIFYHFFSCCI